MPIDQSTLDHALNALRAEDLHRDELDSSLRRIVESTCSVFGVAGAGLMLVDESAQLRWAAATDGRSAALEAAQAETGQGPCVDSLLRDQVVHTDDLTADERWPVLGDALDGIGHVGLLGVPIHVGRTSVGSLNVYTDQPSKWGDEEVEALEAFGVVLEELLRQALTAHERHVLAEQLDRALTNRVVIERAVGVVMAEQRVDPVVAFNVLRDRARAQRRKVSVVAEEVLADVQSSGAPTAPPSSVPPSDPADTLLDAARPGPSHPDGAHADGAHPDGVGATRR